MDICNILIKKKLLIPHQTLNPWRGLQDCPSLALQIIRILRKNFIAYLWTNLFVNLRNKGLYFDTQTVTMINIFSLDIYVSIYYR